MDARPDETTSGDRFRGQVLLLRGRAGLTQRALAVHLGISEQAIQKWEAGQGYPSAARLQALIALYLERGVFTAGHEAEEALALWEALRREATQRTPPFDAVWFARLRPAAPEVPAGPPRVVAGTGTAAPERSQWQTWGEAPDVTGFQGRHMEVETLSRWLVAERCRMVAVLGLGGIGKTALVTHTAQVLAPHFAGLCWRSLRNAPPPEEWLGVAIAALAPLPPVLPPGLSARLGLLLGVLRERRCLLVLDNLEAVLEPGAATGRYRTGYEGYGEVLRQVAESGHQSALLLTGREAPPELALLAGVAPVRALHLGALDLAACRELLQGKGLVSDDDGWTAVVSRYGGNPLALNLVGQTIATVFGGEIDTFLAYAVETSGAVFGGMRRLLEEQFGRLSALEQSLLYWLAVEREPVGVVGLRTDLAAGAERGEVLEALEALGRRSMLERGIERATHMLQPVLLEYVSERLVAALAQEVVDGRPALLASHAVVQATNKDYVRRSQERLLAGPLLERLVAACGDAGEAAERLGELLTGWRGRSRAEQGYGPGNVVNLLRLLRGDLRGLDLSRLAIRHAFLQEVGVQDASLAGAYLAEAMLGEAFAYPTAVALSADGVFLAAGTPTGEVRLWRAADRTLLLAAQGHSGEVWGLALSGDGRLLVSGSLDGTVRLWEAGSGQLLAILQGHIGGVWDVALTGDGRLVASGGFDGTVRLWEAASGQLLTTLQGHTGEVKGVALTGDGGLVASGGEDGTVRLWETGTGQLLATLQGHTGAVYGVALTGDGRLLASGGFDGMVRLWEVRSGRLLATLEGHTGGVWGVALSGDGRLVSSGSLDGMVRLWEGGSGRLLATLQGHTNLVRDVALSGDGRLLASGSLDGTVRLWEGGTGQLLATLQGHTNLIRDVALSGDGRLLASGSVDGAVRLWEAGSGQLLATLLGHTGGVWGVALSGDGHLLASGGDDALVRLWEVRSGQLLGTLQGHTGLVRGVALSADGRLVASGSLDETVRLWEARSGQLLATLQGRSGAVRGVALSEDGQLVASGSDDGSVRLWEAGSGQLLATLQGHTGAVRAVALTGDGRLVASGGFDGTVRLWEAGRGRPGESVCSLWANQGQLLATLQGQSGLVYDVALSGDGRLVASGSLDGVVRLWEAGNGQLLATVKGETGVVWGVALSGDGRLLASGGDDGTVRVWAAENGAALRTLRADRRYERLVITGLTGVNEAQRAALLSLGAIEQAPTSSSAPARA
jgi:WD40 repeat protein/transcriptional regulator with XRE-family HTH domain